MNKARIAKIERIIKPHKARPALRTIVIRPGDPEPSPEDVAGKDTLIIRIKNTSKLVPADDETGEDKP